MRRTIFGLITLAAVAAAPVQAADHTVEMLNNGEQGVMVFAPGYLKVAPGDTVTFKPTDSAHNSQSVLVPDGGAEWKGEISKEVTVTLDEPGVYIYECQPHVALAMVGVIQVGEPGNLDTAKKKAEEMAATFATNKDRLNGYLSQVK
ncbi:MAG: pseudoazurin [Salinisphaeraceae bacterium]